MGWPGSVHDARELTNSNLLMTAHVLCQPSTTAGVLGPSLAVGVLGQPSLITGMLGWPSSTAGVLGQPSSTDGVLVGPSLTEGVLSWSLETIADVLDCFLTALVRMTLWIPKKHKKNRDVLEAVIV